MLSIKSPLDFHEQLANLYELGLPGGDSTGWPSIDQFYTVATKQWTVVTGPPNHGKSEWLDALTINMIRQGWQMIYFSPENQPHELHIVKQLEKWLGKPFGTGPTKRMTKEEYIDAGIELAHRVAFITVDAEFAETPSVSSVIHTVARQVETWRKHGTGQKIGVVIDPWNEMDHARPQNLSETEYISQTLSMIRQFARDWDLHIWLVAHPTKLQKNKDGTVPVARLYDISGSAHFANKADCGISVQRDFDTGAVFIHVLKVRFKNIGKIGTAEMSWDRVTGRYIDPTGTTIKPNLKVVKAGSEPCPI